MTAAQRNKGAAAERRFVNWLREHGYPDARRNLTEGGKTAENRGDIDAIPAVCFDVKDREDCKPGTWMRQAEKEAGASRLPVVIYWPPRDGEWIAMLRVTELLRLLEEDSPCIATGDCEDPVKLAREILAAGRVSRDD